MRISCICTIENKPLTWLARESKHWPSALEISLLSQYHWSSNSGEKSAIRFPLLQKKCMMLKNKRMLNSSHKRRIIQYYFHSFSTMCTSQHSTNRLYRSPNNMSTGRVSCIPAKFCKRNRCFLWNKRLDGKTFIQCYSCMHFKSVVQSLIETKKMIDTCKVI